MHSSPFALRGRVVLSDRVIDDGVIVIEGDDLAWVGVSAMARNGPYAQLAAKARPLAPGAHVLPGLVDIHNHGGGGASFPDSETAEQALVAAREHLRHGTTSLVASLVTASPEVLIQRVAVLAELADRGELAGIHLEGPFLSKARCGAQDPACMQAPDADLIRAVGQAARGHFVTMTIAPEIPGNTGPGGVIEAIIQAGALPSFGHTDASAEQVNAAVAEARELLGRDANARSARPTATHLFNGMRPIHHRDPGPALACIAAGGRDDLVVELVGDGTHLDPETVREIFDLLGPHRIMLVTDAMAAAGMPDGEYILGPVKVRVAGGVARLAEGDSIAGGTAHLLDVVRATVTGGVALADAVRAASLTPATVLGRSGEFGELALGLRANVVVTDAELRPLAVYRNGREI